MWCRNCFDETGMAKQFLWSSLSPANHSVYTSLPQLSETVIDPPHCCEYNLHLIVLIITHQPVFVRMSLLSSSYFRPLSQSKKSLDEINKEAMNWLPGLYSPEGSVVLTLNGVTLLLHLQFLIKNPDKVPQFILSQMNYIPTVKFFDFDVLFFLFSWLWSLT